MTKSFNHEYILFLFYSSTVYNFCGAFKYDYGLLLQVSNTDELFYNSTILSLIASCIYCFRFNSTI